MVHILLEMMKSEVNIVDDFVLKLGSAGYIDMKEYNKQSFVTSARQNYLVAQGFPRLIRTDLPAEIVNAEYQLDLPSLSSWVK